MIKKLMTAVMAAAIAFTPVGGAVFHDEATVVSAKSYKSGKRSFNLNNSGASTSTPKKDTQTNFFNKKSTTPSKSTVTKSRKGGIMKGLLFGGLAGLLLGSLLGNLGILGSIIGLFINIMAIALLISIIRKIFVHFKKKRKEEEMNPWRG
ncbi:hypothetical protein ACFOU2_21480 [Bacillus songklensis]|uniref:Preprotein translocase subunit Tim44 n=1 Tax=Bacillus songklensis TaxID=1069116 RepID=A0ABV8B9M7_9BACI